MKENMKLSPPDKVGYRFFFFFLLWRGCQQPQLEIQIQTGSKYLTLDIMRGQIAAQVTQTARERRRERGRGQTTCCANETCWGWAGYKNSCQNWNEVVETQGSVSVCVCLCLSVCACVELQLTANDKISGKCFKYFCCSPLPLVVVCCQFRWQFKWAV